MTDDDPPKVLNSDWDKLAAKMKDAPDAEPVAVTKHHEVHHPAHYQGKGGIEAIDVIEAFDLGNHLGNVIKYVLRADKKGKRLTDLKKALWYLQREISKG